MLYVATFKKDIFVVKIWGYEMRKKGSFEYGEEHEDIVYKLVTDVPRTTNAITSEVKTHYFEKIHPKTVERLLENLRKKGRIKKFKSGRVCLWVR